MFNSLTDVELAIAEAFVRANHLEVSQ